MTKNILGRIREQFLQHFICFCGKGRVFLKFAGRKAAAWGALALAALFGVGAVFALAAGENVAAEPMMRTETSYTEVSARETYILRTLGGRVAVFSSANADVPLLETDISVDGLRAVDQDKLAAGIRTDSYEQIVRLLEDFGS